MTLEFAGVGTRLAPGDIEAEAAALGCNPAALRMFVEVEARGAGFQPNGRPVILFEAHLFGRRTGHIYDDDWPNISAPSWDRSLYGASGDHQYDRLLTAIGLNREMALRSASWGLGQVLGDNFKMVGFADVEAFVAAMVESERRQLQAMLGYLKAAKLVRYLLTDPPGYAALAKGYNGSGQVPKYSGLLRVAYQKWIARPVDKFPEGSGSVDMAPAQPNPNISPARQRRVLRLTSPPMTGDDVHELQQRLSPIAGIADGRFGTVTEAAVESFQQAHRLKVDGVVGPLTWAAIEGQHARAEMSQ